jgi:hypothetical protein
MDKPIKLAIDDVLRMRERAANVPVPEPTEVSRQRALAMMAPVLLEMHERGHTWPAIVRWLNEQGLSIRNSTLQKVLRNAASVPRPAPSARRTAKTHLTPHAKAAGAATTDAIPVPAPDAKAVTRGPPVRAGESPSRRTNGAASPSSPAPAPEALGASPSSAPSSPKGTFVIRPDTPDL